jgi:hypothetical protein
MSPDISTMSMHSMPQWNEQTPNPVSMVHRAHFHLTARHFYGWKAKHGGQLNNSCTSQ